MLCLTLLLVPVLFAILCSIVITSLGTDRVGSYASCAFVYVECVTSCVSFLFLLVSLVGCGW